MAKLIVISFILFLSINCFSQTTAVVGNYYWTKFVLAINGNCRVEITPNGIPNYKKDCWFLPEIKTNAKIRLKKIVAQKNWVKMIFHNKELSVDFTIFLKNVTKTDFQKSFALAFSKRSISDDSIYPSCNVKTRLEVLKKIGFPDIIQKQKGVERWIYRVNWVGGQPCSYDETYIEIKNGIVTSISGII